LEELRPKTLYWAVGTRYCAGVRVYVVDPNLMPKFEVGFVVKTARPDELSVLPPVAVRNLL
jgi:hypothetical protein